MEKQNDIFSLQDEIKKTTNLKERIRLCAILAHANGHSLKAIASILRIPESSVTKYLADFHEKKS